MDEDNRAVLELRLSIHQMHTHNSGQKKSNEKHVFFCFRYHWTRYTNAKMYQDTRSLYILQPKINRNFNFLKQKTQMQISESFEEMKFFEMQQNLNLFFFCLFKRFKEIWKSVSIGY